MKTLCTAKNDKNLFLKCLLATVLCNLFFYFVYHVIPTSDPFMFDFTLGLVQICTGIGLGIYIRKQNKEVFQNQTNKNQLIWIVLLADLFGLLCFMIPDLIVIPYTALIMFFYDTFQIERIFTLWDFYSCLFCFNVVFLFHKQKQKAIYNY